MEINLPNDIDTVARSNASAAGFGGDVERYVTHLVLSDRPAAKAPSPTANNGAIDALSAFEQLGLVACIDDAPIDLATNPSHLEGFGQDDHHAGSR